jgi:uncharacterized protein YegP (UPF0339 family)
MHFSIWKSKDDQYYWEIVGDNHEIMAVSETYKAKASAEHAIGVVQADAAAASVIDHTDGTKYARKLP